MPRRWVGGTNGLSVKLSQVNGLGAEAPSQVPPDPHRSIASEEENPKRESPRGGITTTRPAREPGLTGCLLRETSPPLSNGHGVGNQRVSGPAGALPLAQPPGLARLGRQSLHECWVRLVPSCSPRAGHRTSNWIAKPGRRQVRSTTAATPHPGNASSFQGRWTIVT